MENHFAPHPIKAKYISLSTGIKSLLMKSILSIFILLFSFSGISQNRNIQLWQQVDSLTRIGQSQTALDLVIGIYEQSKADNQPQQFLKASLYRMKLEAEYQEDYFENAIARTQLEIKTAKAPVKQILHSVLAELYWNYYQNNRWQILSRSETSGFAQEDIKTWDLKKLVAASVENYSLSLTETVLLKNTELGSFDEILLKQKGSDKYRPTLFDFLAHRAIDFYASSEAGLTKPAFTFTVDKSEYFAVSTVFAATAINTTDTLSFDFQALKLLREIVAFHLPDSGPTALVDAELERFAFVHEKSVLAKKDSLFLAALYELESRYKDHPSSTEVAFEIASQLDDEEDFAIVYGGENETKQAVPESKKWDRKKAVEICEAAISRFPDSFGAGNCSSLIESIKQSSLSLTSNYAVIPAKPSLALVSYKNVSKVYFRLIRINPETDRDLQEKQLEIRLGKYLSMKAEMSWEQALPDDGDFRTHSAEIRIPAVKPGYYVLLGSSDAEFPLKGAIVTVTTFWESNISYLNRRNSNGNNEIVVLNRESGQPVSGVNVQAFYHEYDPVSRKYVNRPFGVFTTDKTGLATIPGRNDNNTYKPFSLVFNSKKDQFITEPYFSSFQNYTNEPNAVVQTRFFTDRAIYRPGQTIYFKGIVLERKGEDVQLKTHFKTEVTLHDANKQIVSKQTFTSNDFGSFSGSFVAPQGMLTGQMTIRSETGAMSVQVEEYKRPKFEVTFEPVKGSYKLGETIVVKGKAQAYAGSSVSDAKVSYRVIRNASFPYWWGWRGMPTSPQMEIINSETVTGSDGSFTVTFTAIPDLSVERKTNPVFTYTVYADVTDINGESHSSETGISVGYKALLINTDLEAEINLEKGVQFSLNTTNLNGEKEAVTGTITISKLKNPDQILYQRKWGIPDKYTMTKAEFEKDFPGEVYKDEDDITTWPEEETVFAAKFSTPEDSAFKVENQMQEGIYVIRIRAKDAFGEEVLFEKYFKTFRLQSGVPHAVSPAFFTLLTPKAEPGENVTFLIGTPVKKAHVIYEIIHKDKVVSREILSLNEEQRLISIPVKEEYRGNFGISLVFVKNNRTFAMSKLIQVPYTDKKLDISFSTFRNKLLPGQEEEWQITLRDSKGEKAMAEMLAGMYDASLDEFLPHRWFFDIAKYYSGISSWHENQCFGITSSEQITYPDLDYSFSIREYDQLNWFGFSIGYSGRNRMRGMKNSVGYSSAMVTTEEVVFDMSLDEAMPAPAAQDKGITKKSLSVAAIQSGNAGETIRKSESKSIQIRKNLNETAFFFPQLTTNEKGEIVIKFKAPEALTRWKIMGLAHTKDLKYGHFEKTLVTQKDLMIFTNAPRFLREGDKMDFSAKVSNISGNDLTGAAELHFFDALTMKPVDDILGLSKPIVTFTISKGLSSPVSWQIVVPEGLQAIVYRITATAGAFSDGEEAAIPVLTNRTLVTESMPLPVNGMQQRKFSFEKLLSSGKKGSTLSNYRLTLEYTSNPAWYAVQALPYLMEYPYECAEQLFSRYYANSLATHIAGSDPKIKRVFESWATITPDALKSNLDKNEELKSVLLQESPWVRQSGSESERKQRIALLFDLNRMASEQSSTLKKLRAMQYDNGGWPWFPGMPESRYITQHIITGMGHLTYLNVLNLSEDTENSKMLGKAISYLDAEVKTEFEKVKKNDKDYLKNNHLGNEDIQYLYARTYFLADYPYGKEMNEVVDYFKAQSAQFWNSENNYMKAMIALYLNRFGEGKTASLIMRSLKEKALFSDEMGMYWRAENRGWYWYQAPVETQALLIEAFDEVSNDKESVEKMKIWLLKQKQTQDWKTTKATAEAVYALLLRGPSLLTSDKQVEITLGSEKADPFKQDASKPEAGTGYFKTSWEAASIIPEMGKITVNNPNPTVAWGALYWQYFEQLDKITAAETPMKLSKKLFREVNTPTGPVIEPINENSVIQVGDKIVVRVELRSDRDMEYIHLKDMRASAFEPVNVLSQYKYQDGLGYYESTRDASTNFFIGFLPKGTYVFEYKLVATQKGDFSNGITTAQSMYAPEFSAHSEGIRVKVE